MYETVTIIALLAGPVVAILTQLGFQYFNKIRDQKLWVYAQLISNRATWASVDFVRSMNVVDVVFYKNAAIREKRTKLMAHIRKTTGKDGVLQPVDWDTARDIFAEMMDLMGKELGYEFEHTEIKDSAYYPVAHEKMDRLAIELREKAMDVLEARRAIPVVAYTAHDLAAAAAQVAPPVAPAASQAPPGGNGNPPAQAS